MGFLVSGGIPVVVGMATSVVVAGSLPVLVVAFAGGLAVQAAWNYLGMQDDAQKLVEGWMK